MVSHTYRFLAAIAGALFVSQALGGSLPKPSYLVRLWTTGDGLPAGHIQALCESRDGYLWIGTQLGLARFNGTEFKILPEINCLNLAAEEDGAVWVGTSRGLYRGINGKFEHVRTEPSNLESKVRAMCAARGGGVWVYERNSLLLIRGTNVQRFPLQGNIDHPVNALSIDRTGGVWMLGRVAVRWNPNHSTLEHFPELSSVFRGGEVRSAFQDSSGAMWFCEQSGCSARRFKGGLVHSFPAAAGSQLCGLNSFAEDEFGTIWVGTANGLGRIRENEIEPVDEMDDHTFVGTTRVFARREEGFWVTSNAGLHLVRRKKIAVLTREDGLAHDSVWSICDGKDGTVWIGTSDGVSHWQKDRIRNYGKSDGLIGQRAKSVLVDDVNKLWVGTDPERNGEHGVLHIMETNRFTSIGFHCTRVTGLCADRGDSVWILASEKLSRWDRGTIRNYPLHGLTIFADQKQNVWLGHSYLHKITGGAVAFDAKTNGLPAGLYAAVHEDEQSALWILSSDKGLFRYKKGRFANVSSQHGLHSDLNFSMLDDGFGRYWFNCYKGIYSVPKEELNAVADGRQRELSAVAYGAEDGLLSIEANGPNTPNACKASDGRLWFPTTKGAAIIDPRLMLADGAPPVVVIEEIRVGGELVRSTELTWAKLRPDWEKFRPPPVSAHDSTSELRVAPRQERSLLISFSSPSFIAPEKTRYRWRLDGRDKDWSDAIKQPFVHLADLKPGHYRLRVTASNFRGVWNPSGAQLAFYIAPRFYETWSFRGACALGILGAAAGINSYRRSVQRRLNRLEKEAALARERERIARDLHDHIGSGLTRIAILTDSMRASTAKQPPAPQLNEIAAASNQLVDSMSELVWVTNPKYDTLTTTLAYFRQYTAQFLEPLGIEIQFDIPEGFGDRPIGSEVRRQLFSVLKESLNNIAKHARASELRLAVRVSDDSLEISVSDNGCGFTSAEARPFHHGLANMRERIVSLGGQFNVKSTPGEGTILTATVPLGVRTSSD